MSVFSATKAFIAILSVLFFLAQPVYAGTYTVIPGDSIHKISTLFSTSNSKIINTNNLTSNTIYPGQKIKVPCDVYYVKSGDSLYLIARKYGIALYSLRKANNEWDNMIYLGQKLNLPGIISNNAQQSSNSLTSRGSVSKAVINYSSSDLDVLARLITAEASGESYLAKVGVGAVIINRVKNPDFPNSIKSVIYQKDERFYQFTPVENGWINKPASADSKRAAYDALHGSDPTHGAIFYFDDSATNRWLWSRTIAARIGKMVYTY